MTCVRAHGLDTETFVSEMRVFNSKPHILRRVRIDPLVDDECKTSGFNLLNPRPNYILTKLKLILRLILRRKKQHGYPEVDHQFFRKRDLEWLKMPIMSRWSYGTSKLRRNSLPSWDL